MRIQRLTSSLTIRSAIGKMQMKCLKNKSPVMAVFLGIIAMLLTGCHGHTYKDRYAETGEISTLDSLINIHGSTISYLKIHGTTYRNVCGTPPHFLKIPGEEIIVFLTRSDDEREAFAHIVKLNDPEIITISMGDSLFGSGIGKASELDGWSRDWIKILFTKAAGRC